MKQGDLSSKKCAEKYDISLARKLFYSVCTCSFMAVGDARNGDAFHCFIDYCCNAGAPSQTPSVAGIGGQDVKQSHGPEVFSGLLCSCCTGGFCRRSIFLLNACCVVWRHLSYVLSYSRFLCFRFKGIEAAPDGNSTC